MATSLAVALAEKDAVRVSVVEWPRAGLRILTRKWQLTEDALREAAISALNDITDVTDPKADQQTYAGDWRAVKAFSGKLSDKEGLHVYQVLAQGEFAEATAIQTLNNCQYEVWTSYYWFVDALPVLPANYPGHTFAWQGVSYDKETGLYSGAMEERIRLYQDTGAYPALEQADVTGTERKQFGVTDEVTPDITDLDDGQKATQDITPNEDCTDDVRTNVQTVVDQEQVQTVERADETGIVLIHSQADAPLTPPAAGDGEMIETDSQPTDAKNRHRTMVRTRTAVNQTPVRRSKRADFTALVEINTQASAELTVPDPEPGQTVDGTSTPTEFLGRHRTELETRAAIDQQAIRLLYSASETAATEIHTQADAPLDVPEPEDGERIEGESTPTEYRDRNRTVLTRYTVHNQTPVGGTNRADETSTIEVNTQADTPLTTPAAAPRQIVRGMSTPTDAKNRHRTELEIRTAVNQVRLLSEVRADETVSRTINTQLDAADAPAQPPVEEDGKIKSVSVDPTEFADCVQTTEEVREARDQQAQGATKRADETAVVLVHTQADAPLTIPDPGAGEMIDGMSTPTQFPGRHRTELTRRTAVDQVQRRTTSRADETGEVEIHTQADTPLVPPVALLGQIVETADEPTTFRDRTRTTVSTRTAVNQSPRGATKRADETSVRLIETHATAPLDVPEPGDGEQVEGQSTPTEFNGTNRTELVIRTAVDQVQQEFESRADQTRETTIHTQNAGTLTIPATAQDGVIQLLEVRPTAFSNRRETKQTSIAAINQTITLLQESADETLAGEVNTQAEVPLSGVTAGDGEQVEAQSTPTEFPGRWRTEERRRSAVKVEIEKNFFSQDGDRTIYVGHHLTDAEIEAKLSALTDQSNNTASLNPSAFKGRFDLGLSILPASGALISGDAFKSGERSFTYTNNDGKTVIITVRFTTSLAISETFLNRAAPDGYTLKGMDSGNRTGWDYVGRGRVAATRVEVQN